MVEIREGRREDIPQVFELVKELARHEGAEAEVTNTPQQMQKDGFGDKPAFGVYVAEKDGRIVGAAIYYFRYSTWRGKRLYLEDIVVTQALRGNGVGAQLFERIMEKAQAEDCAGLAWQVSEGNDKAGGFYRRYGARFETQWVNCSLDRAQLRTLLDDL